MIVCFATGRLNLTMALFIKRAIVLFVFISLINLTCGSRKNSPFGYCGGWIGQHSGSNRIGRGTAELIAPSWAITAAHVAKPKATKALEKPEKEQTVASVSAVKSKRA